MRPRKTQPLPIETTDSAAALNAARVMARALAEQAPDKARLALARAFCFRLVQAWWEAITGGNPSFPLRTLLAPCPELGPLPKPAAATADSIGQAAAAVDPETAAYVIGLTYTGMLPPSFRASQGIYYTPPQLTERLIDQVSAAGVDWARCRVLDPACGGGAFLAPVAQRILKALPNVNPAILVKNVGSRLSGIDLDPFAAWLSQVTLEAVMLPICQAAGCRLPVVVTVGDSLQLSPPQDGYDLVIGNPPYGRVSLPPTDRARFARSLFGHANLYGLFTDLALQQVRQGGVVAYVTPTSFLAGEYFKNLRRLLGSEAPPVTIDFVASRKGVFEDVLQETLLAVCRRGGRRAAAKAFEVTPHKTGIAAVTPTGAFKLPADASQPWLLPRTLPQAKLIKKLRGMPHRLADWGYHVSTGPLVWNRFKPQLQARPGRGRFPLIWAEAVTSTGTFQFRADKRNHQPYFAPTAADAWLITREPCVLLQRTTSKEQSRRLIAAALPASFLAEHQAVVVENHLNMICASHAKPSVAPETLAAYLNSAAADHAFRCISGSVAVSAYELEALALPDPQALKPLAALVKRKAGKALLEAECERLFADAKDG